MPTRKADIRVFHSFRALSKISIASSPSAIDHRIRRTHEETAAKASLPWVSLFLNQASGSNKQVFDPQPAWP